MNRENVRSPARSIANNEFHHTGDEVNDISRCSHEEFASSQASVRIEELARQMGLSQSALEGRFRRNVGTSPKQFASILRLKNAVRLRALGHDFTSIAHSAGYSDQSHFTNDFKRVTGLAPSAFFQQSSLCRTSASLQVAFASN